MTSREHADNPSTFLSVAAPVVAALVITALGVNMSGCGGKTGTAEPDAALQDAADPTDAVAEPDAAEPDAYMPESCGFDYDDTFTYDMTPPDPILAPAGPADRRGPDMIAHLEPLPKGTQRVYPAAGGVDKDPEDIVMPQYNDDMPLFERAVEWPGERRCYETPVGVRLLTRAEAYQMYKDIAELTTGVGLDPTPGVRTVLGIRGAYPGRLVFHGNLPDRFNDTLVLMWLDPADPDHPERVREFPVNTDTGAYDFGWHSSSSLRPNRRYFYINGWHNVYNALHIPVRTPCP